MATIKELVEKRAKAVASARAVYAAAEKAGRSTLTAEERQTFDRHMQEARTAKSEIDSLKDDERRRDELDVEESDLETSAGRRTGLQDPNEDDGDEDADADRAPRTRRGDEPTRRGSGRGADRGRREEPRALQYRMASGRTRRIDMAGPLASDEYREQFATYLRTGRVGDLLQGRRRGDAEERDLVADSDTQAGYLITPQQMAGQMIKFLDDAVWVRQLATVYPIPMARSLGAVSLDADPDDGEWTPEASTGTVDSSMKFGKRELNPMRLAKAIKLSNDLIRMAPNVEALVTERLGYKLAIAEEKGFLTGSGAEKPLGLFTASNDGIGTSRDLSTGNTTTAIVADNLIRQKMNLKVQYRRNAVWIFHRDAVTQILLLKDGNGQYLWRQALSADEPDTLLNRPVYESEYAPNTFTTGKYVGLFGDLSYYWIADGMDMQVMRSEHRYVEENKTFVVVRKKVDGMPVLAEAFTRVKLG